MKKGDSMQHSTLVDQQPEQVRKLLPRGLRRLATFILMVFLAVSLLITAAAFRPFAVTLPTPMFAFDQSITPSYAVNLTPNAQFGEPTLPAGRIYVRDYTQSVSMRFDIVQRAAALGSLVSRTQAEAVLQIYAAQDPSVLLLEKRSPLLPVEETVPTLESESLNRTVTVPLAGYRETAAAFLKESGVSGNAVLTVRLTAELIGSRFGQSRSIMQTAAITIPLTADSFQIAVAPAAARSLVTRPIRFLVEPEQLPMFVYPMASILLLLCLVLFLALTASRPVHRFQRELNRLLRQGRRQILMIADKAWEPEWCVTVSDFRSMVQTARRLRHPIFCYVDTEAAQPAAYFYVYYGENNYCYVFTGRSRGRKALQAGHVPAHGSHAAAAVTGRDPDVRTEALAAPAMTLPSSASGTGRSAAGATASDSSPARFQTGPFRLPPLEPGAAAAAAAAAPAAFGPMMPSPEPFLDLIRDPWPAEAKPDEDRNPEPASAAGLSAAKAGQPAASSQPAGTAAAGQPAASVQPAAPATAVQPAGSDAVKPAPTAPAPDSDSEHTYVPILPETDASFFRSSLF